MWLFSMFDLPVDNHKAKKEYTKFRSALLKHGFRMFQFSVYGRYCSDENKSKQITKILKKQLPPRGQVRFLAVTEKQFGKMEVFHGKKEVETEKPPEQLLLF